jgi:hypothetical protein
MTEKKAKFDEFKRHTTPPGKRSAKKSAFLDTRLHRITAKA